MDDRERQLGIEGAERRRVGLLAIAAGLLYLIGEIIIEVLVYAKEPSTGLLQGLTPALEHGAKAAVVDPRGILLQFLNAHGVIDVVGWTVAGVALVAMSWPLRYLYDAAAARGTQSAPVSRALAVYSGPVVGVSSLAGEIARVIGAHDFAHARVQNTAAYNAAVGGAVRETLGFIGLIALLALAIIFVIVAMRAMRVGLVTRVLGYIGIIGGVLFVVPIVPLPVLQLLFLLGVGMMLLQVGGLTLTPAWITGEAIPWVPQPRAGRPPAGRTANRRWERETRGPLAPVPTPPPAPSRVASKKRKRRRS